MFRDWKPPPTDPVERFWHWMDEATTGRITHDNLASMMHHLATVWEVREEPNVVLVHYADLQRDLEGEMCRLARRLDIDIDEDRVVSLAAAAAFDTMRERADELAPNASERILQNNRAFFRSGRSGQWRELLDDDGCRRYADASRTARTARSHRVGAPRTGRQPRDPVSRPRAVTRLPISHREDGTHASPTSSPLGRRVWKGTKNEHRYRSSAGESPAHH